MIDSKFRTSSQVLDNDRCQKDLKRDPSGYFKNGALSFSSQSKPPRVHSSKNTGDIVGEISIPVSQMLICPGNLKVAIFRIDKNDLIN
ncbi:MAG: hypothetical protein WCK88_07210 [bacterium]